MKKNKIIKILKAAGLTSIEVQVYLALLQLGTCPASVLAKREKINRSTARYTLEQLTKKQLALSITRSGTFYFSPEPPKKIMYLLETQKREIKQTEADMSTILGDLQKMLNPRISMPKLRFFEGIEGMKSMLDDILTENKPIFGIIDRNQEDVPEEIREYLNKKYAPERQNMRNPAWIIFQNHPDAHKYQKLDKKMNRVSLVVDKTTLPIQSSCQIYGNKVSFYNHNKDELTGIIVENSYIKETQYSLFKSTWDFVRTLPINEKRATTTLPE